MDHARSSDFPSARSGFFWAWTVAVMALVVAVQMRFFDRTSVPMDEGQLVVAATRILDGEVLYRDVYTGIGPGIYHVTAGLFAIFGRDLLVTRWAEVGVNAVIAVLLWLLAARIVRFHWATFPPAAFLLLIVSGFPVLTMLNYSSLALALALASLFVLLRYFESGRSVDGIALGGLLAATALTKQNYGAIAIVAVVIAIIWSRPGTALANRSLRANLIPIAASGGALAFIVVVFFSIQGALPDFIAATILDLGGPQLEAFNNPIPPIFGALPSQEPRFIFLYTPPALFNQMMHGGTLLGQPISLLMRELATRFSYGIPLVSLAAAPFALRFIRGAHDPRSRRDARVIVVFATLFFLGIFPSAIWSHLTFVVPPTLLVLALLLDRSEDLLCRRTQNARRIAIACAALLSLICMVTSIQVGETIRSWFPVPLESTTVTLSVTPNQAALYRRAAIFVEGCAGPEEFIFVAPDIPIVYFLTGRKNPTPYELTIPGNVDGQLIIERLEKTKTRCVVYNPRMYPEFPPFEKLFPDLSRYLRKNFRQVAIISGIGSEWHGLVRRGGSRP